MWRKKPNSEVRAQLAEHAGDKLELIVVHPYESFRLGHSGCAGGVPLVDRYILRPPVRLELRRADGIVIQGP